MKIVRAIIIFIALLATSHAFASDWPQYLGPDRNSQSNETGLLRAWPENGPEVLWTAPLGIGYGGPVTKDGKVYLLDREAKVADIMRCFDLSSGKEIWNLNMRPPGPLCSRDPEACRLLTAIPFIPVAKTEMCTA